MLPVESMAYRNAVGGSRVPGFGITSVETGKRSSFDVMRVRKH
jgi:hypothetical protein